jgi:sec-independent protein translocase protein TatB
MFNVGGGELLIILFVALVVLGPDKLPDAARKIGNVMGEVKRMSSGFQDEFKAAMDAPNKAVQSVHNTVSGTTATPTVDGTGETEEAVPADGGTGDTEAGGSTATRPSVVPEPFSRADDDIRPVDPTGASGPVAPDNARTDDPAA